MKVPTGQLVRAYSPDPEVLERRGREHEERHLKELHAGGGEVVEIELADTKDFAAWERAAAETTLALRRGVAAVYQGTFFQEGWSARPDFLVRVGRPSDLGTWSYEVVDTKLARHARARAIIQLCVYSEMLGRAQGLLPETMRLILGGDANVQEYRPGNYLAYVRALRRRFLDRCGRASDASLPEPVEHCDLCDFWAVCDGEWPMNDHLSLVAGISRHQREQAFSIASPR